MDGTTVFMVQKSTLPNGGDRVVLFTHWSIDEVLYIHKFVTSAMFMTSDIAWLTLYVLILYDTFGTFMAMVNL